MDGLMVSAWDDDELMEAPSRAVPHRRVRSDPTDIMQALRAERERWGGAEISGGAAKRDLSPLGSVGMSPAFKKHAAAHYDSFALPRFSLAHAPFGGDAEGTGTPESADDDVEATGKSSKKDVPMWTVEEDLLILQLVERHGKRWSKIALHLPGRTDNGVRNRWNRMERAQVLRQRRGPEAGYRCRRCGQPKRGHICAALTLGATPAGDELQQKAQALSKLSADRMRPPSAASDASAEPAAPPPLYERPPFPAAAVSPPAVGRQPSELDEAQLDDFLEELQLHELTSRGQAERSYLDAPPPTGPTAMLSQASLQQLLMTLAWPEGLHAPHAPCLAAF
ncbi:hypothetical protein AB1Y20_020723 [Prymnesium parvum]|uniref:Myb-like domain-containing protein n=1 Tax=Prymnesium parvum TaxID=97485 RepID=A0AB34JYY1_PRYPA